MKKLFVLGFALLFATLSLPADAAQFMNVPAGKIKMDLTKKPVAFPHEIHTTNLCSACHATQPKHFPFLTVDEDKQCVACHHPIAGTTPKFKCGTAGCHNPTDMHEDKSYYKIIHDTSITSGHVAYSCLGCHSEVVKTRPEKKLQLTGCSGSSCHPKN